MSVANNAERCNCIYIYNLFSINHIGE